MIIFIGAFILLLCVSAPITVALGGCAMVYALIGGTVPITTLVQTIFGGLATFPLLAIPLFMLAGNLMNEGGLTPDLVRFARLLLGHIRGGLGLATILACAIFAAISGAAVATAVAIGVVMIPAMKKAGYDPAAAVTLQETFVRLSKAKKTNWLEGLFASHPPSEARVEANKKTLKDVGEGGDWGRERYAERTGKLRATREAYTTYDEGVKALSKGDAAAATTLAQKAIALQPREAIFHELLGDVATTQKRYDQALRHYAQAMDLNPNYFKPVAQTGIALYNLGQRSDAATYLQRSVELLPTAPAHYLLGVMAEERGDLQNALKNYEVAAGSNSDVGKQAAQRFVRLDLPRNPDRYIKTGPQLGQDGTLYAIVQNAGPVPLTGVRVRMVRTDGQRVLDQTNATTIPSLAPGKQAQLPMARGVQIKDANQLRQYRVIVESAAVAQ